MNRLVLLPGLLNDARLWAAQAEALADIAQVDVPDLTLDDSLPAMARRVLDNAPEHFALGGLSMGGYLAMEIMRTAPHRVTRLALISTSARPDSPEQQQRRRDAITMARQGRFARIVPTVLVSLVHPDHARLARVGGIAKDMARSVGAQAFIRQQTAMIHRPDSRPALPRILCPTLIAVGTDDAVTPIDRAEEMLELIPNSQLLEIRRSGHLLPLEQPDAVSQALREWLQ